MEEAKGCAEGAPLLNKLDESTTTPGYVLVGRRSATATSASASARKFRQRFGIVADAIAKGLGRETAAAVDAARDMAAVPRTTLALQGGVSCARRECPPPPSQSRICL